MPETTERVHAKAVSVWRVLPRLICATHQTLVDIGNRSGGDVIRLSLGLFRPYLVTRPTDVQRVLRDNADNYTRDGSSMLWRSVRRLVAEGILSDGETWRTSRRILQPLFSPQRIAALGDEMAVTIRDAVDELDEPAGAQREIDAGSVMARIVCSAVSRAFFGAKLTPAEATRILSAHGTIAVALRARLLVPFVPNWIPVVGDRAFRAAVRAIDDVLLPVIEQANRHPDGQDDVISTLCRARTDDGNPLSTRQIRDDTVGMFAVSMETTHVALTWLWPLLNAHPAIAERLYEEIDQVIGDGPVGQSHLPQLHYTRMVLDELVRLYPAGWLLPRRAVAADTLGRVRIPSGATVIVSPWTTQRMSAYWERPEEFDPERFSPGRAKHRPRYAYFPFGGGPHQCLGMHLFYLEAQLIVATLLSRYRFRLSNPAIPAPTVAGSLHPGRPIEMTLLPIRPVVSR